MLTAIRRQSRRTTISGDDLDAKSSIPMEHSRSRDVNCCPLASLRTNCELHLVSGLSVDCIRVIMFISCTEGVENGEELEIDDTVFNQRNRTQHRRNEFAISFFHISSQFHSTIKSVRLGKTWRCVSAANGTRSVCLWEKNESRH